MVVDRLLVKVHRIATKLTLQKVARANSNQLNTTKNSLTLSTTIYFSKLDPNRKVPMQVPVFIPLNMEKKKTTISTNVIHSNYNKKLEEIFIVFSIALINQLPHMPNLRLASQENHIFSNNSRENERGG